MKKIYFAVILILIITTLINLSIPSYFYDSHRIALSRINFYIYYPTLFIAFLFFLHSCYKVLLKNNNKYDKYYIVIFMIYSLSTISILVMKRIW